MIRILLAAVAAATLSAAPLAAHDDKTGHPERIHVHDAYALTTGGAGGSGAVFMMLHNHTETDDRLIGAATPAAKKAELHTHVEEPGGMMRMIAIEGGIPLPAGEMHELARGGDHVMLMGLTRPLADGEIITVTLSFEKAGEVTLEVPVDNARAPDQGHGSGHDGAHGSGHGAGGTPAAD